MQEPYHILEIPSSQLKVHEMIGEGQFGIVHMGVWDGGLVSREPITVHFYYLFYFVQFVQPLECYFHIISLDDF